MNVLQFLIIILVFIIVIGIINERFFHMQSDIALVFFSMVICLVLSIAGRLFGIDELAEVIGRFGDGGFEKYLMDGALCFMLFSGAGKVNMYKFRENLKAISLLALLTTLVSAFAYGAVFYGIALVGHLPLDFWTCVLLGCVVSPTDPIAATGILNKIGLSKNVCSVIENESLFNDGTGVTLFIFVRSLIIESEGTNFLTLMLREILGAVVVALVVSFLLFRLLRLTKDPIKFILISLLDVSLVYMICEALGCSGVIASVVCGMYFSWGFGKKERRAVVIDSDELYKNFWEIMESLLNSVLFVMIGMMIMNMRLSPYLAIVLPAAVLVNIIARVCGVSVSSVLTGWKNLPGNYSLGEYVTLMTWSALKGGLSLALAFGTIEFLEPEAYLIFIDATYITIFFTVMVQGLSVKKVYYLVENHKKERMDQKRKERSISKVD